MKKNIFSYVITVLAGLFAVSCTVKEDRTLAPCWLTADISLCSGPVILRAEAEGFRVLESVDPAERPEPVYEVPRSLIHFCALTGLDDDWSRYVKDSAIVCPPGAQYPPLGVFNRNCITIGCEEIYVAVEDHKRYCTLNFHLPEEISYLSGSFIVQVLSSSTGYLLQDFSVKRGEFEYTSALSSDGTLSVRVPKQGYGDLRAVLYRNGESYKVINLSEELSARNYDWDAEDLEDVTVLLPVGNTSATIYVGNWDPIDDPLLNMNEQ